jgi:mono/diheme cytochrome c family protein
VKTRVHASMLIGLFAFLVSASQAQQPGSTERGKYLMESVLACGQCHAARGARGEPLPEKGLSGGMLIEMPPYRSIASNITPDPETGIGKWSDAELFRALREGVRPDGTVIRPPMPVEFYRDLSDDDLNAVIANLRAQAPVRNAVDRSTYSVRPPASLGPRYRPPATPKPEQQVAYGKYLVAIAHCLECHTPRDGRGGLVMSKLGTGGQALPGPWGQSVARDITQNQTGLRGWTDTQMASAIRKGIDRQGNPYKPPMPYNYYKNITDGDMAAMIAYLRTLQPQ